MAKPTTAVLLEKINGTPVFGMQAVRRLTGKDAPYARLLLHRLAKTGRIRHIERGRFTISDDPFAIASRIIAPAYISLWSALQFYGLTEQLPKDVFVTANRQKKQIVFMDTRIRFVFQKRLLPFRRLGYRNMEIFIAEPETAVVESLMHQQHVPVNEAVKALQSGKINFARLKWIANGTGNVSLLRRLGFILEKIHAPKIIAPPKPMNIARLDLNMPAGGNIDGRWGIEDNNEAAYHDVL
ncbi:hypothetical protein COX84_07225 [Candidatus Micrarchaeota archaeon CG_4_10_14_0_2_um_filter_49_7]|nr:MAG: hypothetical protein AUJ13_04035 [Candidatus Micrarchaeota archaeon CG1_02_49_24]PIZ92195.1 MAG: hypothetical protein COX84_07225 [Candidatus Micrarchaeota archaeon CG_4_10_14_0_2_um_filter_49_7]